MADWLTSDERQALEALQVGPITRLQQELLGEAVERLVAGRTAIESAAADLRKVNAGLRASVSGLEHLVSTQRGVAQAAHEECSRLRDERDTAWSANTLGRKQVERLEFKNAQLRADCDYLERSRLEYKYRYEKACEAHGDMVDRYHEASKQQMLLHDRVAMLMGQNPTKVDTADLADSAMAKMAAALRQKAADEASAQDKHRQAYDDALQAASYESGLADDPVIFPTRGMTPHETSVQLAKELRKRGYDTDSLAAGDCLGGRCDCAAKPSCRCSNGCKAWDCKNL